MARFCFIDIKVALSRIKSIKIEMLKVLNFTGKAKNKGVKMILQS